MPKLTKSLIIRLFKNSIFFGLSKGVAFIAPILLIRFVCLKDYGIVEYSYSMGSVLAIIASFGFAGSYPYFILKIKDCNKRQVFLFYSIPITVISITFFSLYHMKVINETAHFIIVFTLIFSIQRILSSKFKTEDKGYIGVIIDGGYYFVLITIISITWLFSFDSNNTLKTLLISMEIYLLCLCLLMLYNFFRIRTLTFSRIINVELLEILKFSYKLIISSFIVFWLTSSARIYVKWLFGYEEVGIYSFYFRIAGISHVLYQFLYIAFFKKLYVVDSKKMDKYYSAIIILVTISCFVCGLILPYVSEYLHIGAKIQDFQLYAMLSLQMPVWVGFALGEGIIARENIVSDFNKTMSILVITFPLILYLTEKSITLFDYCFFSMMLFGVSYYFQLWLLSKNGVRLKRCFAVNSALCIISIVLFLAMIKK